MSFRECKDCVLGREITNVLKTAVDKAILELCHSCDFFASPLIKWCGVYSNQWIIQCALRSWKPLFSPQTHLGTYVKLSFERSMKWRFPLNPYTKNVLRNEAIYHFRVTCNSYHTSAEIKSIPFQSSLVMFLKARWSYLFFYDTRRRPSLRQLWITQSVIFTRQMWLKPKYTDNVIRILFSLYSLLDLSKRWIRKE